ncbi:MAG: TerC family protein [Deltaproteobacteria bacterium]|nr:TerC family protein [Deltaproteobacteria bacterium]
MTDLFVLFTEPQTYVSLLTLTLMEIVLGIDNVVFLSILVGKLPAHQQPRARLIGLSLAFVFRIILLLCITWIIGLVQPLFSVFSHEVSGRDLILIAGGLFLIAKSTKEIHGKLEHVDHTAAVPAGPTFASVVIQVAMLDLVFSFDSVITAVGLVDRISIMIVAVVLSMIVMLMFAAKISEIVDRHPTIKMLALSFLLMIGTMLVAEGCEVHVQKGYVYFAMAFSVFVEFLNIRSQKAQGVKH